MIGICVGSKRCLSKLINEAPDTPSPSITTAQRAQAVQTLKNSSGKQPPWRTDAAPPAQPLAKARSPATTGKASAAGPKPPPFDPPTWVVDPTRPGPPVQPDHPPPDHRSSNLPPKKIRRRTPSPHFYKPGNVVPVKYMPPSSKVSQPLWPDLRNAAITSSGSSGVTCTNGRTG